VKSGSSLFRKVCGPGAHADHHRLRAHVFSEGGRRWQRLSDSINGRVPLDDALSGSERAPRVDRWIFVAMAVWFIAITLSGFIPSSLMKIEMARSGARPEFPVALHVHAVVMGAFLCLLLAQSWLVATGRHAYHARLGIVGTALAIAVVVSAAVMIPTLYHQTWDALQVAPPDARAKLQATLRRSEGLLARQFSLGILFSLFMTIALCARTRDSGLHKRMIFLATGIGISAGANRIPWLPITPSLTAADLCSLAAVSPLFIWDVVRNRRVHKAYWIWLAACLPFVAMVHLFFDAPWWHATARQIMGV
jgi:hypothetical protein